MIKVTNKEKCCGCMSCAQACPVGCIEMQADAEGFLYPSVDQSKCISCNKCERVCPIINDSKTSEDVVAAYTAYSKNEEIKMKSSSGAIFTEIAQTVFNDGGVVFGAAFDDNFMVKHIHIESEADLWKLQSSKYLQSTIGNTYKETEAFLKEGRKVLYTGTGCQIAGLKTYLKKEYDNLLTIDVLCHGVPSPLVWRKYLTSLKKRIGCEIITSVKFRVKEPSWNDYSFEVAFSDGQKFRQLYRENTYMKLFLRDICLRPSCHECSFKNLDRYSDITLGDCWGVENVLPEMYDKKGVSVVIVHSESGAKAFESIKDSLVYKAESVDVLLPKSADSRHAVKCPKNRDKFFEKLTQSDDVERLLRLTEPNKIKKIYRKLRRVMRKHLGH